MERIRIIFSAIAVLFAVLGLVKALSSDICMRVMYPCLGISLLANSAIELRAEKKISAAIDFLLGTCFLVLEIVWLVKLL